jgi:hypothetical protein
MVKRVRLYVEGASDVSGAKKLRAGMSEFLSSLRDEARRQRAEWTVVACGHREEAYRDFRNGQARSPEAFNILLVDSEGSFTGAPREHLAASDGWELARMPDQQVQLMVQAMEAWFMADPDALASFYGNGFVTSALPRTQNVENIPKSDLLPALKRATHGTSKGEYHKTRHAFDILARLDPEKVRRRAPHCDRLFETIHRYLAT